MKKEFRLMLGMVVIAGFAGGMLLHLFIAKPVFAQKKSGEFANFIKAENFELVDKQGKTRARLMMGSDDEPMLLVYDKNQKPTAAYGLNAAGGPIQNMLDRFLGP